MIIENITFRQYLELENRADYDFFIKYSIKCNTAQDIFNIGDFTKLTFEIVKDLQYDLANDFTWMQLFEYIYRIKEIPIKKLGKYELISLCQARKYMIDEIKRITEIENIALAYIPDDKEIRAGIEKLASINTYLQFRTIAQSLNLTIQQVKNLKYEEAFLELVTQNMLADYEKKLIEIKSEKVN